MRGVTEAANTIVLQCIAGGRGLFGDVNVLLVFVTVIINTKFNIMQFRFLFLILLPFSLLFVTSCDKQLSKEHTAQQAPYNISQETKSDTSAVFPIPGSKIENEKVDSVLETVGLSFLSVFPPNPSKEYLLNVKTKLKQLLQKKKVRNDKELLYVFHEMLSSAYAKLYGITEQKKYLQQSEKQVKTAISLLKGEPKYKADLASSYMALAGMYRLEKKYNKSISLIKYLIENYQNVGFGPYSNWLASRMVGTLHNYAHRGYLKPEEAFDYIEMISQQYNNEVGVSAQIELLKHYLQKGKQSKVKRLSEVIENRVSNLNNPTFRKIKWRPLKNRMQRMKEMQSK